ncbi:MAG: exopolysaccharide biosynthesis protein [Sulfitobacter sp.]|nr:exopolysaccharide biosynthesis protein [Sulfitobacter sp.]
MARPDRQSKPSLTRLLDRLDSSAKGSTVSIRELMDRIGQNAITPFVLLVALLVVSPLSGIPGTPTISALIIVTMCVQALSGRKKFWLPGFVLRRRLGTRHLHRAVGWLRKPCAFLDAHSQRRLAFLTEGPMRWVNLALCALIPLVWPLLEVLPMVTSIGAAIVALLVFGIFTRDGVYVLWAYVVLALLAFTAMSLI